MAAHHPPSNSRYVPRTHASDDELSRWREQRARVGARVAELTEKGICYQCEELSTGLVLGPQSLVLDEPDVRVALAADPRAPGHTIVVWKAHVQDFTSLEDADVTRLFTVCRDVAKALRAALSGVERVYQVSMCDGPVNHLHIQLIPRYSDVPIGSQRLVDPRGPLLDGPQIADRIRGALETLTR
ncbi:HIT family protein [Brachybacterium sp. GCM10030252]|uniref:HIT family protein n=1 Tax=Brachybacterium sp. GCM10030252 TaxID=3273380 RepID=UPI0036103FA7